MESMKNGKEDAIDILAIIARKNNPVAILRRMKREMVIRKYMSHFREK